MHLKNNIKLIFSYLSFTLILFQLNSSENILKVGYISNPLTIDPMLVTTSGEFDLTIQLFEGLTTFDPKDLSVKPGIAKEWESSIDRRKFTFYLRKNTKWSDGTLINAYTIEYSLFRVLNSENNAPYAYLLFYIKNAKKYYEGKIKRNEVGIKVLDDFTIEIELENPTSFFLGLTMLPVFMPAPKHIIEKYGNNWIDIKNIVCNGPFKIVEGNLKKMLNIMKNDYYWDKKKVKIEQMNLFFFNSDEEACEKYLLEELNFVNPLTSSKNPEIINNPEAIRSPILAIYFYRLNVKRPVLADVRVRRALYLSINRNYLCRKVLQGGEIPAWGFVPVRMPGYNNYHGEREDPGKARELLKEAGYPNGKGFPKLKILFNNLNEHKIIAVEIQKMWKEELNIDVLLEEVEFEEYRNRVFNFDYDIARSSWVGDYIDPSTFLDIFEAEYGKNNRTGWYNSDYAKLIQDARKEVDLNKRNEIYYEAEKILINNAPIIPIKNGISIYLLNRNIKGIYPNAMDIHPLKEAYYDNDEEYIK